MRRSRYVRTRFSSTLYGARRTIETGESQVLEAGVNGRGAADTSELRALASRIVNEDPAVRDFVIEALATIEALRAELRFSQEQLSVVTDLTFLDGGHRARLEDLVLTLQREVDGLNALLGRVRAVADFSEWAAQAIGSADDPMVRTEDLRRAIAKEA
jgi:hypothetical protein